MAHGRPPRVRHRTLSRENAGSLKHTPASMEDLMATCPLVPSIPHLVSGGCLSRISGIHRPVLLDWTSGSLSRFILSGTPPHDDALVLLLSFGSTNTWCKDLHPTIFVPCIAHAFGSPARFSASACSRLFGRVVLSCLVLGDCVPCFFPPKMNLLLSSRREFIHTK